MDADLAVRIVLLIIGALALNRAAAAIQEALRRRDLRKFWEKHGD